MAGTVTALRVNEPRVAIPPHLWDHQRAAYEACVEKPGSMLAMGMGSGKTAVAIALLETWLDALKGRLAPSQDALVLCPKSVAPAWLNQFERFGQANWRALVLDAGSTAQRAAAITNARASRDPRPLCVVLNYDVLTYAPIVAALKAQPWGALVLDEIHKVKAPAGKQSRIASQLADRTPRRLGLTGTPMPHSPLDVYAQCRALDKSVFGTSFVAFRARYAVMGGYQNHEIKGYQNLDDLHKRLYWITYRCRTEDVLDLPPYTDVERYCDLSPLTRALYDTMRAEMVAELETGTITADNALVKLLRLAQIANGFVKDDEKTIRQVGDEKSSLLAEVLDELKAGWGEPQEPVVVFARFHPDLDAIHAQAEAAGLTSAELSGRRNDLADWQHGSADVLAVQLQAGGVGVDLTRARYCIYYGADFSLGNYEQSRARVHRPGQERPVTYIHLIARGTVDETIRKALVHKGEIVRFVVDDMLRGVAA